MIRNIKYYCFYDNVNKKIVDRSFSLAAANKINYISQVLNSCSIFVELISLAVGKNRSSWFSYFSSSFTELNEYTTLRLFPSISSKNIFIRVSGRVLTRAFFLCNILIKIKKGDTIIVYHSLGYASIFRFLKKIKKIKLILEVEEIYADISGKSKDQKKECKFFNIADAFIFSTELLEETINIMHKPYIILHGIYGVEYDRGFRFDDNLTHVVYSGTLDSRKGVSVAIDAALYLDSSFHIHILGFGTKEEEELIINQVRTIREESKCLITFEGLLYGEEFTKFIQACNIGLSPQNPDASFNSTSFPSKILTYLANGLKVVSIRIPAIERSAVGVLLNYYEEQTPQNIAREIIKASRNEIFESRGYLNKLNNDFKYSLLSLLE